MGGQLGPRQLTLSHTVLAGKLQLSGASGAETVVVNCASSRMVGSVDLYTQLL